MPIHLNMQGLACKNEFVRRNMLKIATVTDKLLQKMVVLLERQQTSARVLICSGAWPQLYSANLHAELACSTAPCQACNPDQSFQSPGQTVSVVGSCCQARHSI